MKNEFLQFLLLAGFLFFGGRQCALFAQTSTSAQSGNYNDGSTWVGGNVPAQGNNIIIKNGHTVTLDVAGKDVHDITIEAGAVFDNVNFDLRIQKASGNPTYKNDGIHNSGTGRLILYNNYYTRVRGTGVSNIDFNVRDYGIKVLYDCNLTINGNLQHHINYTYASMTLIDNTEGGTLTINGNIIPQPDKAISITNGVFDFQGTTYVGNITVNGDVYLNSLDSWWAGTACGLANEGGLFYISGDLILGGGYSLVQNNQPNAEFTIAGDMLGPGLGDWEALFINSSLLRVGGNVFPPAQNGNLVVDATSTVEYFGNAAQTIFTPWDDSFEDGPYNNLIINNSSEAGLNLSTDITVNNILTLNNGLVNLGDKNLLLGDAATISGTPSQNSMIIATGTGELRKRFGSVGSFSFPVGDNDGEAEYAPVTVSFSVGTFANGLVSMNLKNLAYPGAGNNHVKRYWKLSSSGISDYICDLTFQYNESDVEGDESQIACYRVEPTEEIFDPANTTLHVLTATNVTEFGTFTGKTQPNTNPPFAFNVTGGGEYCKDEPGIEVGLDNSEADAFYTLYRNNIPILSNVQGTGAAFSFGLQTVGIYTVEGTNSAGTNVMNGSAEVTEIMPLIVGVSITSDQNNVCHGTTVTFTAFPESGGATPAYQWNVNGQNAGTNNSTFNYSPLDGDQVQVFMTSSLTCITGNPASSNVIAMTVNPNLPASVSISATQSNVCQGTSVTFTAFPVNGGATPAYQWKVNGQNAGTNNSTFTYLPLDGEQLQVVMNSSLTCITGNPASSNIIAMTVNPNLPASLSISASQNSICQGTSVTFTASPENGGATPAYQWKVDGQNAGTNNSTFTYSPLDGDQVQVVMTSSLTCVTGNPASSNVIAMTVNPNLPASVSISATQNSVCQGASVSYTAFPENGGATPAYQWKVNGQNAGTNNSTFTYLPLDGDQVQVVMNSSLTCITGNPASSNVIAMTVNPNLPAGVSISATQNSVCQGTSVTFTASPENGGATPAYQWKVNGQNAGTNNSTFTYFPLDGEQVQVVMNSSLTCITGNPASSNVIAMTVSNSLPASVSISATQNSICQGTSVTFTASPENGGATPAYQWKVNGQNAGTNNSAFTYVPLDNDQIQVVMTSSLTCVTGNPASSNVIAMTVNPNLPAGVSISAAQNNICQGTSVSFTAFPENGGATPAYQWKVNGQNAGTNNSTFTFVPNDNDQVQVVMTSSLTCVTGNPASSNVVAMTVNTNLPAGVSISATQNSVCQGTSVTFTASPENGGATPAYQWKVNGQNAGKNNSTFTYSPLNGEQVQVVMTSSLTCVTGNPASSNVIAMTVSNSLPASVSITTTQNSVCQGNSVTFTAFPENGGATPSYQWKVNGQNAGTNSTFNYSPLDGDQVQLVMTSSLTCVTGNPSSSNVIAMTVGNSLPASVSISATQNSVCQGNSVTFTAFPENGGATPAYQWKVNGQNAGTNNSTFTYSPLDGEQVQVVMTSSLTCVTGNPASSNVIAMTVNPNLPASVSISASQNSICQGNSVTFTAFPENGGATPSYQWKVNGQNAGTNISTFNYSPLDGDQVQVVMNSSLTCVNGNPASSNVISITVGNSLPASVSISATQNSVCQGNSVTFTAFPENGGVTPAYQWKVNGQNAGTNNSTFTYSPLDGEQVQVVMTSSLTCVTGNPASSNVIAMTVSNSLPAGVSITTTQNSVCQGTSVSFTAFPVNGGATPAYQWKVNGQNAGTNNSTLTYSPLDGDQVHVVMTSSLTCVTGNPASSNVIAMTVSNSLPASVSITTTQNSVCQGTSVTFTAFPENGGATPAYQWKVNGQNAGTNNSTFTYSPLDGEQVQVVMTSSLTCITGNTASSNVIAMTVNPVVLLVLANPSTAGTATYIGTPIIGQTVLLTAETQAGWFFVNWTNNLGEVLSSNVSFNFNVSGCNPIITANFSSGTALTGKLAYFNNVETHIPTPYTDGAFYARIFDGTIPVSAVLQLADDIPFSFDGLETGKSYTMRLWEETANNLIGQTWAWNNWGGVTALDALIVSYMAVENPVLSAFPWILPAGEQHYTPFFRHVADANNSTSITSLDALILLYRSIGDPMTIPFPGGRHNFQLAGKKMTTLNEMAYPTAPDVIFVPNGAYIPTSQATSVFYEAQLPVIETGANIFNIYMVATGDLNASYNLEAKVKSHSDISFEGVIAANIGDEILIPVRINQQVELGAITIGMSYNKQLIDVVDVIGYDIFNINKNAAEVHIAWLDQNGRSFGQNQEVVVLKAKVLAEINAGTRFAELISTTEFANVTANVLQDISLSTSYVETSVTAVDDLNAMSLNHSIFPNPFNDVTNIHYTLPAAGKVSVVIYNHLGQEVKTLFSGTQLAGAHSLRLNNYDLNGSGTYFYRIMLEGETKTMSARGTIMMAR